MAAAGRGRRMEVIQMKWSWRAGVVVEQIFHRGAKKRG